MLKFSSRDLQILNIPLDFAKKRKVKLYLVGGALRDLLLGRLKSNPDFDFCLKRGAINFGKALAREMGAGFVVLDQEHGACRVVKKTGKGFYTFDFTDFRGSNLEIDLMHRDFTINAIALKLEDAFCKKDLSSFLIDPAHGIKDLRQKLIRLVHKKSFSEDPLRVMRAFSFSSSLGFKIDKTTLSFAKKEKSKLRRVSGERVRDELFKIFEGKSAYEYFIKLDELGILRIIFPETDKMRGIGKGAYHHLDVWDHTLETIKQLEIIFNKISNNIGLQDYLNEEISSGHHRYALLKLGAFLHDIGKPKAMRRIEGKIIFHGHERLGLDLLVEICRRLKLSVDEINCLRRIVLWHLRPGYLADSDELTARAKFRYFRDAGCEAASILLLSLADQRATKGPLTTALSRTRHEKTVAKLLKEHFKKIKEKKKVRLVNGDDLIKEFKLEPSPLIGKLLLEIEELQAIGRLKSKAEAIKSAARILSKAKQS